MVTTNNEAHYKKLLKLRSHGIERDQSLFEFPNDGGWYHEMQELGFNYRMSDINAALGLSQLKKLSVNISKRLELASLYKKHFANSPFLFQQFDEQKFQNAYHLFVIQTENRKELYDFLKTKNIYTQVHYIPVYKHPYYQRNGFKDCHLKSAESYYQKALSLPMFHGMKSEEQHYVLQALDEFNS